MATKYYTYKRQVPLAPGQTLGYKRGRGYYAKGSPAKAKPSTKPKNLIYDDELGYILPPKKAGDPIPVYAPPGHRPPRVPDRPQSHISPSSGSSKDSSGGGGGSSDSKPQNEIAINWRAWLEDWGFPKEITDTLDQMARRYTPAQAELFARDAILYLRGTAWHKQTFPGFEEAYRVGLFDNERSYRSYVTAANESWKRHLGRGITTQELVDALGKGYNPQRVEAEAAAHSYVAANRNDLQYVAGAFGEGRLSDEELLTLGRQQRGVSSLQGEQLAAQLQKAQERLRRIFEGTLATASLSLTGGRLSAPSLAPGISQPDVGA